MRKPKDREATRRIAEESPPPGGRAWQRVRQFALERGLPLPAEPSGAKPKSGAKTKTAAKRIAGKSTKRSKTKKRG